MTTTAEIRRHLLIRLDGYRREAVQFTSGDILQSDGVTIVGEILQARDMAREDQAWIDGLLRDEDFGPAAGRLLTGAKVLFAQLEGACAVAIALGGSGHPDEDWWATWAGERMGDVLRLSIDIDEAIPEGS